MMLVSLQFPMNTSIFFGALLQVAAFDFIPTDGMYIYLFDIESEG